MNFPRLLMTASALLLAVLGLPCVFAPDLVLKQLAGGTSPVPEIIVQLTGALYVGFAILNWMAKGSLIGGIYGRPLALGNMTHFLVGGLALLKATGVAPTVAWTLGIVYAVLAMSFIRVTFKNPLPAGK